MQFARFKQFSTPVWVVLFGTFLTRFTFFMVWPFMAVILKREFQLEEFQIGAIMSLAALSGALFSFYVGYISDKIGRKGVLIAACGLYILAFILLATVSTIALFTLGVVFVGLSRSMLEPPARAMISDLIPDQDARELAHHIRYYMINVGASMGPVLGLYIGFTGERHTFFYVAVTYALYAIGFILAFRHTRNTAAPPKNQNNFKQTVTILKNDHAFMFLLLANLLVMFSYLQQETSLIQYLNQLGEGTVALYTGMIVVNGVVIITLQFPLLRLLKKVGLYQRVYIGLIGFAIAFAMFASIPLTAPSYWWYVAAFVLAVGEVVLFPTFNLLIDRAAPEHLRGAYFGASGLAAFGVALSPLLGGFVLQYAGGPTLFWGTVGVLGVAGMFYRLSAQHRETQDLALAEQSKT
jgi:MFS family permease